MKFIADFHIHSHFSIATSKNLIPEHLEYWAKIKGVDVVGTGDCIHPGWLSELREKLEPAGNGLFRLKREFILKESAGLPKNNIPHEVLFMLTGEISSIYKKGGRVRKVHNVCVFPDFDSAEKTQMRLARAGNIESDGRPILGLDSKIILETVLESSDRAFLIPAHIWTPWFSVLGSKSGFDSIEECYDDLAGHIFALETGLSSDPAMNRTCSFLDRFTLVSNSDAHSPEKLGREANVLDCDKSYDGIYSSLKTGNGLLGTIEFFPEEGKYHYDGHRKCGVCFDPLETLSRGSICPVCGRELTKGVMFRVAELADRQPDSESSIKNDFRSITPLPDLLAEILKQKSSSSKSVQNEYMRLIRALGSEFHILLESSLDDIASAGGETLAEGVRRLRAGEVFIEEGYDGDFGRIKVFDPSRPVDDAGGLFVSGSSIGQNKKGNSVRFDIASFKELYEKQRSSIQDKIGEDAHFDERISLNSDQERAASHMDGACMVLAGPGSGKTRILTERIVRLAGTGTDGKILALTFSNRAAQEIRNRLLGRIPEEKSLSIVTATFHSAGLMILKRHHSEFRRDAGFYIADRDEVEDILDAIVPSSVSRSAAASAIERRKQGLESDIDDNTFNAYEDELAKRNGFDLSDLVYLPVQLFKGNEDILAEFRDEFRHILVDEFQDINPIQYEFLKLAAGGGNPDLFVIGDPDQSIYGFRGSDPSFMKKIRDDYPSIEIIDLVKSYRSPSTILTAAAQVIHRPQALEGRPDKIKLRIQKNETDRSEADWIASSIEKMIGGVRSFSRDSGISDGESEDSRTGFSDFAILCRASFMFGNIREALANHGIPVQSADTDTYFMSEPYVSIIRLMKRFYYNRHVKSSFEEISGETIRKIDERGPIGSVILEIAAANDIRDINMDRFVTSAARFGNDYAEFFRSVSSRSGLDDFDSRSEAVALLTIHASKGLEFENVFIPGCEDGIIPFELFGKKNDEELSEEARLLYVGITRTKRNLFLSWARRRAYMGRTLESGRSPFLDRIENRLLELASRDSGKTSADSVQLDLFK